MPIRVLYINGTKGVRTLLNKYVNPDDYKYPNAVGLGILLAPGLTMVRLSTGRPPGPAQPSSLA